nr:hypothetical protein [Tanacetum cinerariifolium]
MASPLDENEMDCRMSFDESNDEDYTVIYDENSFSYKIISVNDLKRDSKNDNDKVNMPSLPSPKPEVSYSNHLDFFKYFENEFPAIVYNDALTSKSDFLTEHPQHIDELDLKNETPLFKCDKEEQNILYFNDLFPFNVIYLDDLKSDTKNDNDKIDIEQPSRDMFVIPLPNVINVDTQRSSFTLSVQHPTYREATSRPSTLPVKVLSLGVETPLFEGMLAAREIAKEGITGEQVQDDDVVAATIQETVVEDVANEAIPSIPTPLILPSPPSHDIPSTSQRLERANKVKFSKFMHLKKVGTSQRIESSYNMEDVFNQRRMIDDLDKDEGIELVVDQVVTAATSQVSAASAIISAAKPSIPAAAPTVVDAYTRRRKGVIIRDPEEELSSKTPAETPKMKDKGKGILIETPKPMKKKDQIELDAEYARKLHEEINKDHEGSIRILIGMLQLIMSNKNPRRILRMSYDEIRPIFQARFNANMRFLFKSIEEMEEKDREVLKSINEIPAQKAAKRRKLNEEAQEVVDLKKNLETMFEKPDRQDDVWKSQRSVHGLALVKRWKLLTSCGVHIITLSTIQLILLVKRRYPLLKFTLEQLVNVTRLQVEEESKMSLELLRFTRQQLQEYQQG